MAPARQDRLLRFQLLQAVNSQTDVLRQHTEILLDKPNCHWFATGTVEGCSMKCGLNSRRKALEWMVSLGLKDEQPKT